MITKEEIQSLEWKDKMWLFETLWDDISNEEKDLDVPDWHKQVLDERQELIDQGKATFIDWDEAKKQISRAVR